MKIAVALFTKDRFPHLKLCVEWLLQSEDVPGTTFQFYPYDDNSDSDEVKLFLSRHFHGYHRARPDEWLTADQRIGELRRVAVDTFLKREDEEFLVMLDSDILTNKATIVEAVRDFQSLMESKDVGLYTMHAPGTTYVRPLIADPTAIFGQATLTGEANMVCNIECLKRIGNHFGVEEKGFGDLQIRATIDAGMRYGTRLKPPYQVQHLGFGDRGSVIYAEGEKRPFWTQRPYRRSCDSQQPIVVSGFDLVYYCDCVKSVGGANAPLVYMEKKGITP